MKRYGLWKYILILLILSFGAVYSLPNLYAPDPAVQVSYNSSSQSADIYLEERIESALNSESLVYSIDLNEDNAKEVQAALGEDKVQYFLTNVMEEQPVMDAIAGIKEKFGALHVAVNCAGTGYGGRILGKEAPHPLDHFKFIIDLNLVGTFNVMRLAAELMDKNEPDAKGEKGVLINTASVAGYEGQIGQSAYSACLLYTSPSPRD